MDLKVRVFSVGNSIVPYVKLPGEGQIGNFIGILDKSKTELLVFVGRQSEDGLVAALQTIPFSSEVADVKELIPTPIRIFHELVVSGVVPQRVLHISVLGFHPYTDHRYEALIARALGYRD